MSKDMSRRDFLKISSGTVAVIGTTCMPGTLGALGSKTIQGSDRFIRSYCEMCSSRCQIEGRVVDGKNVFIQGNRYVKSMGGSVCARGASGHSQLYDSQRIVSPLIRVGKRGEGKWREASWDEALDMVAKKLGEIKKEHGAESVLFSAKTGEHHGHMLTFANAYGSPNIFSHYSSCPVTYKIAFPHTTGSDLRRDFAKAKYILNFGHNLFEGIVVSSTKTLAKVANSEKTKLVVLEPRFSILSAKADEWYPVKPGTDIAFVLSLIHVWLRDGKYDKKFVEEYTVGLEELKESVADATPEWQEKITGIKASVAENVADELYRAAPKCIIDWGHKTTTGYGEYQRTRAIIIANALMGNVEREGGTFFAKKAKTVNALAGMEIAPEITNPNRHIKGSKTARIDGAGESGENIFVSRKHGVLMDIPGAILSSKPYPVKGWFMMRHNPLITVADTEKMREAMSQLDFIVVSDPYMSECAEMADVILPEATYLERDEGISNKSSKAPAYMMRNKIVEPINGTKWSGEIFRTLARKLGIDRDYKWTTVNEFRTVQAKGNFELLQTLSTKGYASFGIPPVLAREPKYVQAFVKKFPGAADKVDSSGVFGLERLKTPSGKIELFSQKVEDLFPGEGVPSTKHSTKVPHSKHPYILTSGKTAIHTNGHTQNVPYLNMLMKDNPVWVNTQTAKKEGLKSGDKIYLENETAKEKATVFVTEGIRPDTLFAYMGFGRSSSKLKRTAGDGTNLSKLLPLEKGPICSTMITNVGVKIVKA